MSKVSPDIQRVMSEITRFQKQISADIVRVSVSVDGGAMLTGGAGKMNISQAVSMLTAFMVDVEINANFSLEEVFSMATEILNKSADNMRVPDVKH